MVLIKIIAATQVGIQRAIFLQLPDSLSLRYAILKLVAINNFKYEKIRHRDNYLHNDFRTVIRVTTYFQFYIFNNDKGINNN